MLLDEIHEVRDAYIPVQRISCQCKDNLSNDSEQALCDVFHLPQQSLLILLHMRRIPDNNPAHTLKSPTKLHNLPQSPPINIPSRSSLDTTRNPDKHPGTLILRLSMRPPVPLLKVVTGLECIQPALRVVIELHEDGVDRHLVQDRAHVLIGERTLRCSCEIEFLPRRGTRLCLCLCLMAVHQFPQPIPKGRHIPDGSFNVEIVNHGIAE